METYLRDLLTALQPCGVSCTALVHASPKSKAGAAQKAEEPEANQGPRVVRAGVWANLLFTPISPSFPWHLNRLLREESPAVLHLHMPNVSAFWALFLPRARRIPWVIHWHADVPVGALNRGVRWFYRLYRPFEQWALRRAKVIIATSPPYMKSSPALAPFLNKCQVVPLGIQRPAPTKSVTTARGQQPSALKVIAIGRLAYYKGFDVLLRAIAQCPDITLEIIGDGERKDELSALIESLKLGEQVTLMGKLPDDELDQRLRASDCLCLPSIERSEAFGVVLLEAMARSKPCIVTAVPGTGMSWVVQDNHNGLVVPPNDPDALAEALKRLAKSRAKCKEMGNAGLTRFTENFTIEVAATQTAKIYRELAGQTANYP